MRLKVSTSAANEQIVALLNKGYIVLGQIRADYNAKRDAQTYDP
jgi:hypothetical protein